MRKLIRLHTAIEDTRWQEIYDTYDKKERMLFVKGTRGVEIFSTRRRRL